MKKLMTNREMALFRVALWYCKQYHDCCPEVGMGPFIQTLADEIVQKVRMSGYEFDEEDVAECCESIKGS